MPLTSRTPSVQGGGSDAGNDSDDAKSTLSNSLDTVFSSVDRNNMLFVFATALPRGGQAAILLRSVQFTAHPHRSSRQRRCYGTQKVSHLVARSSRAVLSFSVQKFINEAITVTECGLPTFSKSCRCDSAFQQSWSRSVHASGRSIRSAKKSCTVTSLHPENEKARLFL